MHIHILGICGTFMGGLAALAREAGHRVTGCDAGVYPPMSEQLRALGIDLIEGYGADQLALAPDVFVVGNVVSRARLVDGSPKFALMEAILDAGAPYTSGPQWLAAHVLQGVAVRTDDAAALRFEVDVVLRCNRIGEHPEAVAASERFPLRIGDAAGITRRRDPAGVVLQTAIDLIRILVVHGDVIELRDRQVLVLVPERAARLLVENAFTG